MIRIKVPRIGSFLYTSRWQIKYLSKYMQWAETTMLS